MAQQEPQSTATEAWQSLPVVCKEGIIQNLDVLTQGTSHPGSAAMLQNFECSLAGGYRRINGYTKWDSATVPGDATTAVLGVKVALGGVFAARTVAATPTTDIYFSTGSGWGSRINTANRGGAPTRVRMHEFNMPGLNPSIVGTDGVNPAFIYDGTTYTLLNGTGYPSNPVWMEYFLERLVFSGYTNNGGTNCILLTAPGSPNDFAAIDGAIEIPIGDVVTGLRLFRNQLYIFTDNNIFTLSGTDASTFSLTPVTSEIGCIAGDTIQEIGGDLIYLAPDGFRSVAGTYNIGDVDLSLQSRNIQPFLRANIINNTGITQFVSFPVRAKSQYRCLFYESSISKQNSIGVIGKVEQGSPLSAFNYIYTQYAWSTTQGIQAYCGDSLFDSGVERVVIGDPSNGLVYQLESGNDFDGTAIQAVYTGPQLTFQDITLRKVLQKINIYSLFEGTNTINFSTLLDFSDPTVIQPTAVSLSLTASYSTYGNCLYDSTGVYSATGSPIFKANLIGSAFSAAMSFTATGGAPFTISAYQLTYSLKGRR